jgi:hypothetical protein
MIGATIADMLRNGQDPLTATALLPSSSVTLPFLPFLLNTSRTFVGTSGRFTFNDVNSRDGEMGFFNWRVSNGTTSWLQLGNFVGGAFNWSSAKSLQNIRWSTSTSVSLVADTWVQPNPVAPRMLKVGAMFRKSSYVTQAAEWLEALEWATKKLNSELLTYYQLSFEHIDLGSNTATSVRVVRQWIDESNPSFLLGPVSTAISTALIPLAQDANTPMISPNAPGESLSNQFYYRGFARVSDSDRNWSRAFFNFMRIMRWNTFVAVSSTDEDRVIDEVILTLPSDFRIAKRQSFEYFSSTYAKRGFVQTFESLTNFCFQQCLLD